MTDSCVSPYDGRVCHQTYITLAWLLGMRPPEFSPRAHSFLSNLLFMRLLSLLFIHISGYSSCAPWVDSAGNPEFTHRGASEFTLRASPEFSPRASPECIPRASPEFTPRTSLEFFPVRPPSLLPVRPPSLLLVRQFPASVTDIRLGPHKTPHTLPYSCVYTSSRQGDDCLTMPVFRLGAPWPLTDVFADIRACEESHRATLAQDHICLSVAKKHIYI